MLKPNQPITIGGKTFRVEYVNGTGAYVVAEVTRTVTVYDPRKRENRTFTATNRVGMMISADSQDC